MKSAHFLSKAVDPDAGWKVCVSKWHQASSAQRSIQWHHGLHEEVWIGSSNEVWVWWWRWSYNSTKRVSFRTYQVQLYHVVLDLLVGVARLDQILPGMNFINSTKYVSSFRTYPVLSTIVPWVHCDLFKSIYVVFRATIAWHHKLTKNPWHGCSAQAIMCVITCTMCERNPSCWEVVFENDHELIVSFCHHCSHVSQVWDLPDEVVFNYALHAIHFSTQQNSSLFIRFSIHTRHRRLSTCFILRQATQSAGFLALGAHRVAVNFFQDWSCCGTCDDLELNCWTLSVHKDGRLLVWRFSLFSKMPRLLLALSTAEWVTEGFTSTTLTFHNGYGTMKLVVFNGVTMILCWQKRFVSGTIWFWTILWTVCWCQSCFCWWNFCNCSSCSHDVETLVDAVAAITFAVIDNKVLVLFISKCWNWNTAVDADLSMAV